MESPGGREGDVVALGVPKGWVNVTKAEALPPAPRDALDLKDNEMEGEEEGVEGWEGVGGEDRESDA